MKNNLNKILVILIVFFIGIVGVKADDTDYCDDIYPKFETAYKALTAITEHYYMSAALDPDQLPSNSDLDELYRKYKIDSSLYTKEDLRRLYSESAKDNVTSFEIVIMLFEQVKLVSDKNSIPTEDYKIGTGSININQTVDILSAYESLATILGGVNKQTDYIAKVCSAAGNIKYKSQYEETKEVLGVGFNNICDYLDKHAGVKYYVKTILRIVTYVSLALALVLCTMDFIKAITSHDDAALTKAFQTAVKRIVAVVVIFLTTMIVQLFMGLITSIPNYDASQFEICDDFTAK